MPDTFDTLYRTPDERAVERQRNAFLDRWDDEEGYLDELQDYALSLLLTLDTMRSELHWAHEIEEIDFFAAEFAGSLKDLISERIGRAQNEADELGMWPESIRNDTSDFAEQVDVWLARAKARRAERVYMTAADLGIA